MNSLVFPFFFACIHTLARGEGGGVLIKLPFEFRVSKGFLGIVSRHTLLFSVFWYFIGEMYKVNRWILKIAITRT